MMTTKLDLATTTDLLRLLGDPSRVRLLALLEREELTVAELTRITRLPQSRVSTHLGKLRKASFVVDRKHGASSFYRLDASQLPVAARSAFDLVRSSLADSLLEQDAKRLAQVLEGRSGGGSRWADSVAGRMDRHYSPGRTWESTAWGTLGLARLGDVLDVASGDGVTAELLSCRARSVTCLDVSARVSAAGRRRLERLENVRFVRGDMHALPFRDAAFDQVLMMHALTYSRQPARAATELSRVLKPGGQLVLATLERHAHRDVMARFDHVRLGFTPGELEALLGKQGLLIELCRVTSRERQPPHHGVVTVHARKPGRLESRNGR
jgi:SAM-dependent methyltransferase